MLRDYKILIKSVLPLIMMTSISAGLILYAILSIIGLADHTRQIVDVQAVRLEQILNVRIRANEAGVNARNIILETRETEMTAFKTRYDTVVKGGLDAVDKLISMSDTADRKASNESLKQIFQELVAIMDRSNVLGLKNDSEGATKILLNEGAATRTSFKDMLQKHMDRVNGELKQAREEADQAATTAKSVLIGASVAGLLGAVALATLIVVYGITRPLNNLVQRLQRMAEGEVNAQIDEAARGDEIGAVGNAVEGIRAMVARKAVEEGEVRRRADEAAQAERKRTMIELADAFEHAVGGVVGMVSSSATELQATAQQMTVVAAATASQSTTVAAAAQEAASNVATVAAAAEQLGSSVQEIGRQVSSSAQLAQLAVLEADQTAALVTALSQISARIGDMVGMVSSIAGQTNLLALNATIEAARAGVAGRGFAVVASEVKALAEQTAKATDEIGLQIGEVRGVTTQAVTAIDGIIGRIREIDSVAAAIAAAVEQQGAATQEIVRNVAQASTGTNEVTINIAGVAQASDETGDAAGQVLSAASELSRQSEHLGAEVSRFLSTVRAA